MGLLARFFKGGIVFHEKMKFRRDIKRWYNIFILQSTEESVISDLQYDKNGNKKELPPPNIIRKKVLERIENIKKESEAQWQADFQLKQ